jgi:uncharacterized protein YndB with AHSA1/START domain
MQLWSYTSVKGKIMTDRIERSVDIAAPLDRVWDLVTVPGWWVPDDAARIGDRAPGAITIRESTQWGRFPVEVVEFRPKHYAAFRWASQFPGEDLAAGRTTLIEFTVEERNDHVRLSVVESGFATLDAPEEIRRAGVRSNSSGWEEELGALQKRAETDDPNH